MNPLRELAEGWEYRTSEEGQLVICRCTCATEGMAYSVVKDKAAECFADAKPEEPLRKGERMRVKADKCIVPSTGAKSSDQAFEGCGGKVVSVCGYRADIQLDMGTTREFWLINLRRERADERPAEKRCVDPSTPSGARMAWDALADEKSAEPKPEPPPRKYEDGQWFRPYRMTAPLRIQGANYDAHHGVWYYSSMDVQGNGCGPQWWIPEYSCEPCSPPLTDAMKLLCWPGKRVQRIEHQAGPDGTPYSGPDRWGMGLRGTVSVVEPSGNSVTVNWDNGDIPRCNSYVWNLDPVEGGGA